MNRKAACDRSVAASIGKRGDEEATTPECKPGHQAGISGSKRLVAAALAVGAVAALSLTSAPAAQAAPEIKCSGRDYRCDSSGYGPHANTSYWLMATGHNCTNYVAWRLIQEGVDRKIDYLHNGGDWADDVRGHNIPVDHNPVVGAVAQWTSGAGGVSWAGHVAYVEAVGDGWIQIAEDNYSSGPMSIRVIHSTDREWPTNFIHFPRPTPQAATVGLNDPSLLDQETLMRAILPRVWEQA